MLRVRFLILHMQEKHWRSFSGDLPDKFFLSFRLDAAGRIAGNPERPEVTGISGYRIGIDRISENNLNTVRSNLVKETITRKSKSGTLVTRNYT